MQTRHRFGTKMAIHQQHPRVDLSIGPALGITISRLASPTAVAAGASATDIYRRGRAGRTWRDGGYRGGRSGPRRGASDPSVGAPVSPGFVGRCWGLRPSGMIRREGIDLQSNNGIFNIKRGNKRDWFYIDEPVLNRLVLWVASLGAEAAWGWFGCKDDSYRPNPQ